MESNAAQALLRLSSPVLTAQPPPKPTIKQTQENTKRKRSSTSNSAKVDASIVKIVGRAFRVPNTLSKTVFLKQVQTLLKFGYTSKHLKQASYPKIYIEAISVCEAAQRPIVTATPPKHALTPFNKIPYYTSSSPHVLCATCKTSVVICKNGELRTHHCTMSDKMLREVKASTV